MIESLGIRNFRGIRSLELSGLGRINVLVGRNNSSKSSVLEALSVLMAARKGAMVFAETLRQALLWRGWYGALAVDDLFHRGTDTINLTARMQDESVTLTIRRGDDELRGKLVAYLEIDREDEVVPKFKAVVSREELAPGGFDEHEVTPKVFLPHHGFEFLIPTTLRKFGYAEVLYSHAYEKRIVKDSIRILRQAYPGTKGFSPLFKEGLWVLHVETEDGVYPYYLMGEGFKSAMVISFLMPLLEGGYLFIDLAETFHHPKSLRVMAKTLLNGAVSHNVQVFMTTHSPELIELLASCDVPGKDDGKIFHLQRGEKLSYRVSPLSAAGDILQDIRADLGS
ncbi:AAA family ATPase [Thermococcus indicus]|nr:ATP/GTP-binding protein [Thermococcus indicus]